MWDIEAVKIELQERMSAGLYTHSQMVAQTAKELAEHYQIDQEKAYFTGLVHDFAKEIDDDSLVKIANEQELVSSVLEKNSPGLLHAPVGAFLVQQTYNIMDPEIIQAISCHTLAGLDMTMLSKVIYIADKIEPGRDFPDKNRLIQMAYKSIEEAILYSLESTIINCIVNKQQLHPRTSLVRNYLLDSIK